MNGTVGSELQEARKRRQLTIDQLAARTKIAVNMLRALENNDLSRVPPGIFARGFLRAYAREVGLDPESTVVRYLDQFEPPAPPEVPARAATRPVIHRERPNGEPGWRAWMPVGIAVLAVGAVLFLLPDASPRDDAASREAGAQTQTGLADATGAGDPGSIPVATTGSGPTAAAPRPLRVQLRADGPVWVTAHADGARAIYRLMQDGEVHTLDAYSEVVVRAGDAARLTVTVNGHPRPPLGWSGEVVTRRFAPEP